MKRIQTNFVSRIVDRFLDTWRKDEAEAMRLIVASQAKFLGLNYDKIYPQKNHVIDNINPFVATGGQGGRGGSGSSSTASAQASSASSVSMGSSSSCQSCSGN